MPYETLRIILDKLFMKSWVADRSAGGSPQCPGHPPDFRRFGIRAATHPDVPLALIKTRSQTAKNVNNVQRFSDVGGF